MLFGLFERSPRTFDDLQRIRDRTAVKHVHNHIKQLDKDLTRGFQSRDDQPQTHGHRTLYLQSHGDGMVAYDAAGIIHGIVERPLATMQPGSSHQDQNSGVPIDLGDSYVQRQQVQDINPLHPGAIVGPTGVSRNGNYRPAERVAHDIGSLQMPEPSLGPFFAPGGGVSGRTSALQPHPSSHLTLPSPPPSGEPSLSPGSRPASRNNDTVSLSSINQIPANGGTPQPGQISLIPSQYGRVNSAPPDVLTSAELSPLQSFMPPQPATISPQWNGPSTLNFQSELQPSLPAQTGGGARIFSSFAHSPHGEDTAQFPRVSIQNHPHGPLSSTHLSLDQAFLSPSPEAIAADNCIEFEEATRVFLDKLDSMGASQNQPQQTTRPGEDSNSSTMEAMRAWSATMCEILKDKITRSPDTESLSSVSTPAPVTFTRTGILETRFEVLGVLTRLSFALGAAYHVPFQVLLDTTEGLQRYCFEMHRPQTQEDQLVFLTDLLQGLRALTTELQTHIDSPTTPSNFQRLSLPWSMRGNGAEYRGATETRAPAQLAAHRGNSRYPVDDRSPPTVNSLSPISQATSHRLSYADSPRLRGNGIANGEAVTNDHNTLIVEAGVQRTIPYNDGTLGNSAEDETPLSRMRMLQTPRGSVTWSRSPQNSATRNPPIIQGPPVPTTASSIPVEAAPAPIPVLATPTPLPADIPLQHPCPERPYQQAEFMASPGWLRRLRLANLLNKPPFWNR